MTEDERKQRESAFNIPVDGLELFSGPQVELHDWLVSNAGQQILLPQLCASCGEVKGHNFDGYFRLMNSLSVKLLCPQATVQQTATERGGPHLSFNQILFYETRLQIQSLNSFHTKKKKKEKEKKAGSRIIPLTILVTTKYHLNQCSKPFYEP